MDQIDLLIQQKLLANSRLTYRELAEITNISVSAVHKRIRKLEEADIITLGNRDWQLNFWYRIDKLCV